MEKKDSHQFIVLRHVQCHMCSCAFSTSVNSLRFASFVHLFKQLNGYQWIQLVLSDMFISYYMCKTFLCPIHFILLNEISEQLP